MMPKFSTLVELLHYRITHQPDQTVYLFLKDGLEVSATLSYRELDQRARLIAAYLLTIPHTPMDRQLGQSPRALLLYSPGLDFIVAFFACLYAGMVAVPTYPLRRKQRLSHLSAIVQNAQPTVVLSQQSILSTLKPQWQANPQLPSLHWLATDQIMASAASAANGTNRANRMNGADNNIPSATLTKLLRAIAPTDLACLQYTSGSTGTPKGVMLSHANFLHNCQFIQQSFGDTSDSIGVSWLPQYHDMGLIGGLLQPLYVGCRMILMPPTVLIHHPIRWLKAISHYQATTSGGPNFAYDWCIQKIKPAQLASIDLSSWTLAFSGAELVRPDTINQFVEKFGPCGFQRQSFFPCYGMAEATLFITGGHRQTPPQIYSLDSHGLEQGQTAIMDSTPRRTRCLVSCGHPRLGHHVIVVDPVTQRRCLNGQEGEIWVAGDSVALGYWNQPEQTRKTFHGYTTDTNEGPFLRTGDLGIWLDEDELVITGRLKELLILQGQNYYPQDIEQTVAHAHWGLRANAGAAFTIEIPQEGDRLVVVQEVERFHLNHLNFNALIRTIKHDLWINYELSVYSIVLVKPGSIPRTSSGKVRRHVCHQQFLDGTLAVIDDWCEKPQHRQTFRSLQRDLDILLSQLAQIERIKQVPSPKQLSIPE